MSRGIVVELGMEKCCWSILIRSIKNSLKMVWSLTKRRKGMNIRGKTATPLNVRIRNPVVL